jgi:hypothetical protein
MTILSLLNNEISTSSITNGIVKAFSFVNRAKIAAIKAVIKYPILSEVLP